MAYPVRSKGRVLWTPPDQDPQPVTDGYCADHLFVDARETGEAIDVTEPPSPGELWWRFASDDQIMPIPELRGAIQRPRAHPLDPEVDTRPANGSWSTSAWASHASWSAVVQEGLRRKVALYAPAGEPVADGWLITQDLWYRCGCFGLLYELMTPSGLDVDDNPVATGIEVILGIQSGVGHYKLSLPNPVRGDTGSSTWQIWRKTNAGVELVDLIHAPGRKPRPEGQPQFESLMIIPAVGKLVILTSRMERAWVFTRDGGCWPRVGKIGVRVFGCRAWLLPQVIDFAGACTITGPTHAYDAHLTLTGEAHVVGMTDGDDPSTPDCAYAGSFVVDDAPTRTGHLAVTIANTGPLWTYGVGSGRARTPVLYNVQEIHRTVLGAGAAGDPVDLAADIEELTVTHDDRGRGATCTLKVRNYQVDALETSGYLLGHLDDQLKGIGLVTVELAHVYADATPNGAFITCFTGYAESFEPYVDEQGFPMLEIKLGDRSRTWTEGEGTMHDLPDVSGWDLAEAVELLLTHHGVDAADIVWPVDYPASKLYIPLQEGTAAGRHTPDTGIDKVLDDICQAVGVRWRLRADGTFEFRWYPRAVGAADFTLDPTTVTPEDKIEWDARHAIDFTAICNEVEVRGKTRWGVETAARMVHGPSLTDDTSAAYLGRRRRRRIADPTNPNPAVRAQQELFEGLIAGRTFTWQTVGHDLWPGDLVAIELEGLLIPSGTKAEITGKTSSWSEGDWRWRDEYTCRIVVGSLV